MVSCIGAWGVGSTSRPALIIRLDVILDYIPLECKRFFRTLLCPGRFFVVQSVACCVAWEMGGPPRVGPGYLLGVGAGRGQRLVPLHAIPSPGAGECLETGPRGNCVAVIPCGG